jgi:hypothetical protein
MVEALGHASKSPSCLLKLEVNGLIYHPFVVFKNMERYVILVLDFCLITITFFYLWMSRFGNDMFSLSMFTMNTLAFTIL